MRVHVGAEKGIHTDWYRPLATIAHDAAVDALAQRSHGRFNEWLGITVCDFCFEP